jgi:hypothetical protein
MPLPVWTDDTGPDQRVRATAIPGQMRDDAVVIKVGRQS